MSIESTDSVDGVGVSKETGEVVMLISDHLSWQDEDYHFQFLEAKISSYLQFIKNGQLVETIPQASGRRVRINLLCQHIPTERAESFFSAAKNQLAEAEIAFSYGVLPEGY